MSISPTPEPGSLAAIEAAERAALKRQSLRDDFAMVALIGIGTWMPGSQLKDLNHPDTLRSRAEYVYAQADAMIAESEKAVQP